MHKLDNLKGKFCSAEIHGNQVHLTELDGRVFKVGFTPPTEYKHIEISERNGRLSINVFDRQDHLIASVDFCLNCAPSQVRLRKRARGKKDKRAAAKRKRQTSVV